MLYYSFMFETPTSTIFEAVADPTRRHILQLLATNGQLPASDIYKRFAVSHPAISQHLKVLRVAKLVRVEKKAQQRLYQINPNGLVGLEK
jgi:DNA-binding transcriptional ArsR family regulator